MRTIKPIIDIRRALSDGTYPIKISVYLPMKPKALRFNISTNISVSPKQWNGREVIQHAQKSTWNDIIRYRINRIDDILYELERSGEMARFGPDKIKQHIISATDLYTESSESKLTVNDAFSQFIATKSKAKTISIYNQTLSKIESIYHHSTLPLQDINLLWLKEFEANMKAQGLAVNSISVHLRQLRAVYNYALDSEQVEGYPFRKFKIKNELTEKRSLTVAQICTLRGYAVQEHQERYRDIFMLMFYLIGINGVDLFNATKLVNGRLEYRRSKTGGLYSIKIEPEAMEILERYRGSDYLLSVSDNYGNYGDFMKRQNKELQKIGKCELLPHGKKIITPLFPSLTTYWARHTWATIASELDIPIETISAALGHSIGSRVTAVYINFDRKKIDEANRKVIDYINGVDIKKERL